MKVFRDLLTGQDNRTHDLGRWSWMVSLFSVVGLQVWATYKSNTVNILEFATALGAVGASHGVAIMAKFKTEPNKEADSK